MRVALRSLWVWTAVVVLVVAGVPLLVLIRLFDRDPAHYRTGRWFRRVGWAVTQVNPAWTVHVSGKEITDPRRPYVLACNHQSMADIPVICNLPMEMKWVIKIELFKLPLFGWMLRLADDIPVDRADKQSRARVIDHVHDTLRKRCSVMFFPEGTRSRDGRVLRFTNGAFRAAIAEQVPVLPLVVEGTQDALPKHSWKISGSSTIRLKVLEPIETNGLTVDDTPALREQVRDQIVAQLAAWRGVPPAAVDATAKKDQDLVNTKDTSG